MSRTFVKSSYSAGNGGECVEWAIAPTGVQVRDSKDPAGPELSLTHTEWDALTAATATGTAHPAVTGTGTGTGVRLTGRGGTLHFTPAEWHAFTLAARAGECRAMAKAS